MKEVRVRLFPPTEDKKPRGLAEAVKKVLAGKPKLNADQVLELRIGRRSESDYNCVDVYCNGKIVGEIRKRGIDELIEKGAYGGAKYYGVAGSDETGNSIHRISINSLEPHEYQKKPEFYAWLKKQRETQ